MGEISPRDAIGAINTRFGRHAGFRALHAKGQFCIGTFTATPAAAGLTRAEPYQGQPVPATVRFSNGSGDPGQPDHAPDVRGLSVGPHLADGSRTDIVAQSVPRFPVRDAASFIELVAARVPGPARFWRFPWFLLRHPSALGAMKASAPAILNPPASYASIPYYAIHAFQWTATDGRQSWVRYRWVPEREERLTGAVAKQRSPDYLQEDLRERLRNGTIRMALQVQVAGPADDPHDPMAQWASQHETVVGHLEVTALAPDIEDRGTAFVFDPVRLVDGIGLSDDPVLNFRPRAYSVSAQQRTGGGAEK